MTAQAGLPARATTFRPIPLRRRLYGFGSIYGKTIRDSRLAFIIAASKALARSGGIPGGATNGRDI